MIADGRAQEREQRLLLGPEVRCEVVGEEGERVGGAALRRARRRHRGHRSRRRGMVQAEGERERVAVLVRERNQARMAAPTCHARSVPGSTQRATTSSTGRSAIGLIGRPAEATPTTWPTRSIWCATCSSSRRSTEAAEHLGVAVQGARDADRSRRDRARRTARDHRSRACRRRMRGARAARERPGDCRHRVDRLRRPRSARRHGDGKGARLQARAREGAARRRAAAAVRAG